MQRELKPRKAVGNIRLLDLVRSSDHWRYCDALPRSRRIWCAVHTDAVDEKGYSYYREGTGRFFIR